MRTPAIDLPDLLGESVIDGRPRWLFSDGTHLPVIRGGSVDTQAPPAGTDTGAGGDDDASKGGAAADGGAGQGGTTPPAGAVTFTPEQQAHIDKLIGKATGKAKGTAEAEFKKWLDQQAMGETDRLKAEKDEATKAVEAAKLEVLTTKVETAAERAALAAGVKPERVATFMRLVDIDVEKLTDDGKPDPEAIKALVEKAATDNPEFKGTAAPPAGDEKPTGSSSGQFDPTTQKVWTKAELQELMKSPKEYAKHEKEIDAQLAAGVPFK